MEASFSLDKLRRGQCAIIEDICDDCACQKLFELGCCPGEKVRLRLAAPFKGPMAIEVNGVLISLSREEAKQILVKTAPN